MKKLAPAEGANASVSGMIFILTVIVSLVPLLVTPVLPLTDFYAHIARYYILANLAGSQALQENYEAAWRLLPNLGLDVLGVSILKFVPPLMAAKLIAGLIIAAPFIGVLYLSRVLHGQITPLAILLAGLASYSNILIWGFSNFLLGLGVLLIGLGYWIAAQERPVLQLLVTTGLGLILFFIHGLAFALWGLLLAAVELSLAAQANDLRATALVRRAGRLALIALAPVLLFLQTSTAQGSGGVTGSLSNMATHAEKGSLWPRLVEELYLRIDGILRVAESTWFMVDWGIGALLWGLLATGLLMGVCRIDRRLRLAALLGLLLVWITPPNLFGVGHLGERIPLLLLVILAGSLSVSEGTKPTYRYIFLGAVAVLFLFRNLFLTIGWHQDGVVYTSYLETLSRQDTGSLGAAAYIEDADGQKISRTNCHPLPFLMLFNGTAVPTFANPTQQPLGIIGPLSPVQEAMRLAAKEPNQTVETVLVKFFDAKTDTVVVCSNLPFTTTPQEFKILAATPPWILYRRVMAK